ncbi:hypothetical protein [Microbacterium lacticum]
MTGSTTRAVPQTHWINGTIPAAVPPGMEHAILILGVEGVFVDTLASMLTKSAYPPKVEPISLGETPIQIPATDEQIATAARYEQNIRELCAMSDRNAPA